MYFIALGYMIHCNLLKKTLIVKLLTLPMSINLTNKKMSNWKRKNSSIIINFHLLIHKKYILQKIYINKCILQLWVMWFIVISLKKKPLIESLLYTFIFIKVLFFKDKKDMSVNRSLYVILSLGEFPK